MSSNRATARQFLRENIFVADIPGGEVVVVVLTEIWDSIEEGERWVERTRRVRRARVKRKQRSGNGNIQEW